jgi:phosphate transport system substrate-binding protein
MTNQATRSKASHFVQLRGSDTVLSLIQKIGLQYMQQFPEVALPLLNGGTGRGYKAVIDGTADIGMASGPISNELRKLARKQQVELKTHVLGFDSLAVFIHADNIVANLTLDQLQDIYTGRLTDWASLGGTAGPITVYTQNPNRGSFETWRTVVMNERHFVTSKAEVVDGLKIIHAVHTDPGGIGFTSPLNLKNADVRIVSINGALPTAEAVQSNQYPIRRALCLITSASVSKAAQDFIDYCTSRHQGQVIIQKIGLAPITSGATQ